MDNSQFVGRAGEKLNYAIEQFGVNVSGKICADFGSAIGGFVDCLLQHGAKKVYAVETGYGVLDWKLRNDKRVMVMERTNAMHVNLPEKADLITIDTSWTKQEKIIPNALANLKPEGEIITLVKPHYEIGRSLGGDADIAGIVEKTLSGLRRYGILIKKTAESPILGGKGENREFLAYLQRS